MGGIEIGGGIPNVSGSPILEFLSRHSNTTPDQHLPWRPPSSPTPSNPRKSAALRIPSSLSYLVSWSLLSLSDQPSAQAYFAHPYHSWERGLNENTNGLIRQYFPKGIDFTTITAAQVVEVEMKLNRRPRKCLDYQNPNDIFHATPSIGLAA
jgi:hypothetical protein